MRTCILIVIVIIHLFKIGIMTVKITRHSCLQGAFNNEMQKELLRREALLCHCAVVPMLLSLTYGIVATSPTHMPSSTFICYLSWCMYVCMYACMYVSVC